MRIIDVIPLTRIPISLPQILSYFFNSELAAGVVVEIPLGRRKETAVVIDSHEASKLKMEIKKAGYELRPIEKIISIEPLLTRQQIKLALWLGQYYLAPPGIFLKMMMPPKKKLTINNKQLAVNIKKTIIKRQKLILVPTIAQAETQAKGNEILWHSGLKKKQAAETWQKVKNGGAKVIIGTRSAIFLPFANLKNIIIKDGSNPGQKSWDMFPHYRAPEAAQKLAEIFNAKLTTESEIPSIKTYLDNGTTIDSIALPKNQTSVVDMRVELKNGNFSIFSRELQKNIQDALAQKKQIILFVNRRGAANFVLCRDCGFTVKCKNCDAPLAYHLSVGKPLLLCHRCGFKDNPPDLCPSCQSHHIKTVGLGTQKVELEAQKFFTGAKIARLDSDSAPDAKSQKKLMDDFDNKKISILITTQILFSWTESIQKEDLGAAAMVSADTLLHLPDFHSGERTFQMVQALKNISNKAELIIQTYNPENLVIKYAAAGDWKSFYQEEIETRKILGYPPFSQIVKLTFRHKDPSRAGNEAKILAAKLKRINKNINFEISDALPAFIPKEKGKYIWNIIIKFKISSPQTKTSNEFLRNRNSLLQYVPSNWNIDVDPENLL